MTPYYADEWVTLYHGNALEVMPLLPAESFRAVALDPPYSMVPNGVRGADDRAAGTSAAPVRLLTETFRETYRLLVPGGVAPVICDWRRVPDVSFLITLAGLRLATCLAWTRSSIGTGGLFRSSWDPVLVASRGQPEAIDRAGIPNVVQADPPRNRSHPYEKPPALWAYVLARVPVGPVLDPYAGSGAAAEAARKAGRRAVLIEGDESFCELIARRISQGVLTEETAA